MTHPQSSAMCSSCSVKVSGMVPLRCAPELYRMGGRLPTPPGGSDLLCHLLTDHGADGEGALTDAAAGAGCHAVLTVAGSSLQFAPADTSVDQSVADLISDGRGHGQGQGGHQVRGGLLWNYTGWVGHPSRCPVGVTRAGQRLLPGAAGGLPVPSGWPAAPWRWGCLPTATPPVGRRSGRRRRWRWFRPAWGAVRLLWNYTGSGGRRSTLPGRHVVGVVFGVACCPPVPFGRVDLSSEAILGGILSLTGHPHGFAGLEVGAL